MERKTMTQLYAKIKRTSKYYHQHAMVRYGAFPVTIEQDPADEYMFNGGPGGRYRKKDLALYVKRGDKLVRI
jgi:hypothetical protein